MRPGFFCSGLVMGIVLATLVAVVYFTVIMEDSTCYLKYEEFVVTEETFIPKIIMQTYYDFNLVPVKVATQFEEMAQGFKRVLYDDAAAGAFIRRHFSEDLARVFEGFSKGAFKADLFRYCYLYVEGGIYIDIKTELVAPVQRIYDSLRNNMTSMATCLTGQTLLAPHTWVWPCVYQGVIFARPKHPIFLECIAYMSSYKWRGSIDYLTYCRNFTRRLHERGVAFPGVYPREGWTLWCEKVTVSTKSCKGERSRLGVCSVICDADTGETLFITRFSDFPWGNRR